MAKKKANIILPAGDEQPDDFIPEKPEKKTPEKSGSKLAFLADERLHKITGLLVLLASVYACIAISSFLFTWHRDQSLVSGLTWDRFIQYDPNAAHNLLGKLGAWLAFQLAYKGFGIASLYFPLLLLSLGIQLLTGFQPLPTSKIARYGFFVLMWLPVALGFLFTDIWQLLSGYYGHFGYLYLKGIMGAVGTAALLVCYALVFAVAVFNIKFYEPRPAVAEEPEPLAESTRTRDEEPHEENLPALNPDDFILKQNSIEPIAPETPEPVIEEPAEVPGIAPEVDLPEEGGEPEEQLPVLTTESGLVLEVQHTPEEETAAENPDVPVYGSIESEYDPTLDYSSYQFPSLDLLKDYGDSKGTVESAELNAKTKMIEDTLKNYNIGIKKISATIGPTVTLYEIVPQDGVRIAKIKNLEDDIALSLAALGIRIIAPIPGRGTIGIEVPNEKPAMVSMRSALSSSKFQHAEMDLPIAFGKNIQNEVFVADLAKMPHLLMAGATGQGKSVGLNAILVSLLYKKHPSHIKFVLVDPKKVELSIYKTIERHFLAKIPGDADAIITDTKLVVNTLNSLCVEMDTRYDLLKEAGVRTIKEYNAKFIQRKLNPDKGHRYLPYIVVVIDELADLMMTAGKEVEMPIARLAQLARAIGIHLILATQRPSVNIITGTIKANFPARVAFRVSQKTDSRTILDANGADQLIGKGDMLYSNGNDLVRLQCAFVDTPEVDAIGNFIGEQKGKEPYLLPEVKSENEEGGSEDFDPRERDSLFEEAAHIIVQHQQGSTSLLQRRLNLGYNRAGRLIDQLEKAGIVGPFKGSKAREVLIADSIQLEGKLAELRGE